MDFGDDGFEIEGGAAEIVTGAFDEADLMARGDEREGLAHFGGGAEGVLCAVDE